MSIKIPFSIKNLLDNSKLDAVIIDENFSTVWYNNSYGKNFKPFKNIDDFVNQFNDFNNEELINFISSNEDKISKNSYTLIKSKLKVDNVCLITIIPNDYIFNEIDYGVYKSFFNIYNRPFIIFSYPDGKIFDTNNYLLSLCGLPKEHFLTMNIKDVLSEGEVTCIENYLNEDTPYNKPFLSYITDINDEKRFIEISPYLFDNYICFDMHDITSEMHTEITRATESFKYSFLYKHISDGIIIWKDNKILDINNSACKIWRYSKEEIYKKNFLSLFKKEPTYFKNLYATNFENAIKSSFKGIRKDETIFSGELVTKSFQVNNNIINITLVKDLTEHEKFLELEKERKNIEENILNSQKNLVLVYNDDGELIKCNNSFLDFFMCRNINDFIDKYKNIEELFISEAGFIDKSSGKFWYKKIIANKRKEHKIIIKNPYDNEQHIFFVTANHMIFDNSSFVVSFADITETVQSAMALKDANSLLLMINEDVKSEMEVNMELLSQQSKLAMLGEMIGIITHQWKQPLNAIGLIAQNIEDIIQEDEIIDREVIVSMMGSIMRYVTSMGETVDNFRDFFKNNTTSNWFNLRKTLDSSLLLLQPVLKKTSVTVNVNMPEQYNILMLKGSANEFKQVLLNIIINSKDAILTKINQGKAEYGSGVVDINVEKHSVEKIKITIKDNGTGLSNSDIDNIFNMNYTTKGESGTGIGMYMSDMIIKKMGGRIWAENWENGAILSMELPVKCEED